MKFILKNVENSSTQTKKKKFFLQKFKFLRLIMMMRAHNSDVINDFECHRIY